MTLFGWDCSDYDWGRGPMDLVAARNSGVSFFTYKATEGTNTKHVHYGEALNRAKAAGIEFLGAYIVPRSGPSVAAQVDYFLAYVNSATPWWGTYPGFFFQVDTEKWSYDAVSAQRGADVCAEIRKRTKRQVVHYAPQWSYGNSIPQPDPLWASNYGSNGTGTLQQMYPGDNSSRWVSYSGRVPTFLQFGSNIVIGSQHTCDGNGYRGSDADLRVFITGSSLVAGGNDVKLVKINDSPLGVGAIFKCDGVTREHLSTMDQVNKVANFWGLSSSTFQVVLYADADLLCGRDVNGLKGDPGKQGDPGPQGDPGITGPKGDAAVVSSGSVLIVQETPPPLL